MIDPTRRVWQNGFWPLDKDVEAYLKERILIAQPDAKFFYCEGFRQECLEADREVRRKAREAARFGKE